VHKHYIIYNDKVIDCKESEYYIEVGKLVPEGYKFRWAFRTPGGTMINVEKNKLKKT